MTSASPRLLRTLLLASLTFPLGLLAGCDAAGPATGAGATTFSVQVQDDGGAASAGVALTEVKLLLNSIRFNASTSGAGDDSGGTGDDHGGHGHGSDDSGGDDQGSGGHGSDDGAEAEVEFEDANLVVRLDLSGTATPVTVRDVPAGTYTRVTFHIHKPEDAEPISDPDFRDGESGNQRYSVIVRGTVDGQPFELKVPDSMQERLALDPPLVVDDSGAAEVTILVDPSSWFVDAAGNRLDPRDPGNADAIADRIDDSFRAFGR